ATETFDWFEDNASATTVTFAAFAAASCPFSFGITSNSPAVEPRVICAVHVPSPLFVQPDAVEPAAAVPDNDGASGLRPVTGLSLASFAVQIAVTVPPTTGLSGFRVMDECAASSGPATNFSVCCNVPS